MWSVRRASVLLAACQLAALAGCERTSTPAPVSAPAVATPAPAAGPSASAPRPAASDTFETSAGPVTLHPVHHATVWLEVGTGASVQVLWVDPWSEGKLDGPKADAVLVTDIHQDHLDAKALGEVRKPGAPVVAPKAAVDKLGEGTALANGETRDLGFARVTAVPMYNLTRGPETGKLFHDKGRGNGYVIEIGGKRFYVSGDTECIPEMKALEHIDVALVCMNLPYTMPPHEAAECVRAFKPAVLYPYHYRGANLDELDAALAGSGVEVRRRAWY